MGESCMFFCSIFWRLRINILTFLAKSPLCPETLISYLRYAFYATYVCLSLPVFHALLVIFWWGSQGLLETYWSFAFVHELFLSVQFGSNICFWRMYLFPFEYEKKSHIFLNAYVSFYPQCMEEGGVDGALIVQPINHKFDHSLVTRSVDNKLKIPHVHGKNSPHDFFFLGICETASATYTHVEVSRTLHLEWYIAVTSWKS